MNVKHARALNWLGYGCLLLFYAVSGCSSSNDGPPLVPVEGLVTLDGKPLSGADIQFVPRGETRGANALYARSDTAGKFAVKSHDGKRSGAAVGEYVVLMNKRVKPDGSDFVPDPDAGPMDTGGYREVLPLAYSDEAQSPLTATIPDGGTKTLEFKLKSKGR